MARPFRIMPAAFMALAVATVAVDGGMCTPGLLTQGAGGVQTGPLCLDSYPLYIEFSFNSWKLRTHFPPG